ncbi:aminotransferase class V-fold PLP-dependent enzyme [Sphingomonas colocasiae]|uniref:Aminotransferase class V-fold PLP-dependent enzyme n=1 Tax=Sphingomonas colocasiae TaxID=1848973 RepID=A0ABS7PTT7_9SPHN|nr:aminotransferase class V-fold PLP-dependent enzyme [Sphingomonas colocasiae]MBY8824765.1 aminotransferase class V-fold PLP-dependent enzyme [Sphingomonas colocasiae]
MTAEADFGQFRAQFPTTETIAYFNSGSYGLLGNGVRAAMEAYLADRIAKGADWGAWVALEDAVRQRMATLLGAHMHEVAVTASASAGINAVASSVDFSARHKAVVSNYEFPTSAQIWHAQEKRGAEVVHVAEAEDRTIPLAHFDAAIDQDTAIVALSHVCYRHGGKLPAGQIREIARIAHERGALVILDCYQSIGTEPIDVRALGVDFCVGGMLKYLLGSAGSGFLWVRDALTSALAPSTSGWFAQADTNAMDIFAHDPSPSARRFQGGTPPVPSLYAAKAGLDLILDLGVDAIEGRVRMLTRLALDRLAQADIAVATPDDDALRGPMIAIPARDDDALVTGLIAQNIVTSSRDGNIRAGFHAYNDKADVERLVEALARSGQCFGRRELVG